MQEPLKYTVKKNRTTRVAYRMVGVFFLAIGIAFVLLAEMNRGGTAGRIFKLAFGLALAAYGLMLVKASFRKSAFDLTYIFEDEQLIIRRKKKDYLVSYDKITNVNLVIPDPDMRYYVLKVDIGKEQFVLPFMGKRDMCDAIYVHLLKKTGIYQE